MALVSQQKVEACMGKTNCRLLVQAMGAGVGIDCHHVQAFAVPDDE